MVRHASIAIGLGIVLLGVAVVGFAGQPQQKFAKLTRSSSVKPLLKYEISTIPINSPVSFAESRLGKPEHAKTLWTKGIGKCQYLYYGSWQLVYTRNKLHARLKPY
jgi:hypothetical protein